MTKQQIIDAIDAEIKAAWVNASKVNPGTTEAFHALACHVMYITGLTAAKNLIQKAEGEK